MQQIQPFSLWIGTAGDLRDLRRLYDLGIQAVVQVAYEEPPFALPHDIILCRFPLLDGESNTPALMHLAIDTLTQLLEQKFACLICCLAGMSRSPAIAAAALAKLTGRPLLECLEQIAAQHPCNVHPKLLAQLQEARTP